VMALDVLKYEERDLAVALGTERVGKTQHSTARRCIHYMT
jgi:hypothetical protein